MVDWGDQLHLKWIAISPAMQGSGLGRALIARCQEQASLAIKPLTLQVLRNNPALSLYRSCGFEIFGENGTHKVLLRWQPDSPAGDDKRSVDRA